MENDEHFDIIEFIESMIEPSVAVKEADESIEDDISPLEF